MLLIIPDHTRTAPVGLMFKALHAQLGEVTRALDVLVALGTHPPMSEAAICQRLELSEAERRGGMVASVLQPRVGQPGGPATGGDNHGGRDPGVD
ncbi:MAG: hypothetical protein M5U12_31245 [Verrucomicrobia bacterium]|nr:hypothetical protein [Verrucomicrobiota bacterium]